MRQEDTHRTVQLSESSLLSGSGGQTLSPGLIETDEFLQPRHIVYAKFISKERNYFLDCSCSR